METTRRDFLMVGTKLLVMTAATIKTVVKKKFLMFKVHLLS